MFGGLRTTLLAVLVVFWGRSMADDYVDYPEDIDKDYPAATQEDIHRSTGGGERRLTWGGQPAEPAFDHWGCCQCNGVPDQCLGICSCYSNAVEDVLHKFDQHKGLCSKYVPTILLCRNRCSGSAGPIPPVATQRPPVITTKNPGQTPQGSRANCEKYGRKWNCPAPRGPRTCCTKKVIPVEDYDY